MMRDLSGDIGGSLRSFFNQPLNKERGDGHRQGQPTDNDEFHTHGSGLQSGLHAGQQH
jgi:hypothetical protein